MLTRAPDRSARKPEGQASSQHAPVLRGLRVELVEQPLQRRVLAVERQALEYLSAIQTSKLGRRAERGSMLEPGAREPSSVTRSNTQAKEERTS